MIERQSFPFEMIFFQTSDIKFSGVFFFLWVPTSLFVGSSKMCVFFHFWRGVFQSNICLTLVPVAPNQGKALGLWKGSLESVDLPCPPIMLYYVCHLIRHFLENTLLVTEINYEILVQFFSPHNTSCASLQRGNVRFIHSLRMIIFRAWHIMSWDDYR